MTKSPNVEYVERINTVRSLLKGGSGSEQVVSEIMARFAVSRRQAYRYMEEAQKKRRKVVPEQKIVFTVKLPESLVSLIRHVADSTGESLSSLVSQALKTFLRRRGYGRKAP